MKKLLIIAATLAAFSSIKAQDDMDISMEVGYQSKYVFRGIGLADESMTVSIDAAFEDAYLGMWTNQPITGNIDNEFDFYGGMGFDVAEGISMDVGGTLYYYPESGPGTSTFELYAGFAFDSELNPAIYVFYDLDLEAFTFEGSVGHSFEIDEKSTIDIAAFLGFVDGDESDYTYHGASADVNYSLGDSSNASIGVRITDASYDFYTEDGPTQEAYVGAAISTGW